MPDKAGGKVALLHVTSKERIIHLFLSPQPLIKQAALMHTKRLADHDLFREKADDKPSFYAYYHNLR